MHNVVSTVTPPPSLQQHFINNVMDSNQYYGIKVREMEQLSM